MAAALDVAAYFFSGIGWLSSHFGFRLKCSKCARCLPPARCGLTGRPHLGLMQANWGRFFFGALSLIASAWPIEILGPLWRHSSARIIG